VLGTLDLDVVHPVVPEVIDIGEVVIDLQELMEAPQLLMKKFVILIPIVLGQSITLAIDLELVQVIALPIEGPWITRCSLAKFNEPGTMTCRQIWARCHASECGAKRRYGDRIASHDSPHQIRSCRPQRGGHNVVRTMGPN